MKAYVKNSSPEQLFSWQRNGRAWDDFARDAGSYEPVKAALRAEQQHLCCYCEARLGDDYYVRRLFHRKLNFAVTTVNDHFREPLARGDMPA